ncbi:MAG: hypothetical protein WEE20_06035 [Bacteroidota bacterium]
MKRVLITLHGIQTRGAWQKSLVTYLSKLNSRWIPYPLDFGFFSAFELLFGFWRGKKINWFLKEYTRICEAEQITRPSVIAHSFGTYVVARMLEVYPQVKFDKLIFCGSIVRRDYDWKTLLESGRVNLVRNDFGRLDIWPNIARLVISQAGNSGTEGFNAQDPRIQNHEFKQYNHSMYFQPLHFRDHWLPFLERVELNEGDKKKLSVWLGVLRKAAARILRIPLTGLRANIFFPDHTGLLRIPPGLHENMKNPVELTIQFPKGFGCVGKSYEARQPAIAIFKGSWGDYFMDNDQSQKADKNLQWVVSMPIPGPLDNYEILGVLSLDCLSKRLPKSRLKKVLGDMRSCAQQISRTMKEIA